jgi:hypothetical protein
MVGPRGSGDDDPGTSGYAVLGSSNAVPYPNTYPNQPDIRRCPARLAEGVAVVAEA